MNLIEILPCLSADRLPARAGSEMTKRKHDILGIASRPYGVAMTL